MNLYMNLCHTFWSEVLNQAPMRLKGVAGVERWIGVFSVFILYYLLCMLGNFSLITSFSFIHPNVTLELLLAYLWHIVALGSCLEFVAYHLHILGIYLAYLKYIFGIYSL